MPARLPRFAFPLAGLIAASLLLADGFTPADAVKRMKPADDLAVTLFAAEPDVRQPIFVKADDRGRIWTIQYLQYPNPAGLKRVKVDRWSRTVYDRVPEPPPKGPRGADRITICEDTNGDGRADKFKDFVAGLNLCTGLEFGHDGVYVLQAPYLLFYPDRDRDDVPDSDPEVLLTGFGMEDAQSLANHLTFGPDGWLYGLNGSTTSCRIRGLEFQQGVWRYHPRTKEFELFCEGGGNVFGLTFDALGNLFYSSNVGLCWHAHQGAYYEKNLGKHGPLHNPHAYGWLTHVKHDVPTGGPSTGGTIYRGHTFPDRFRDRFLTGDFLRHTASSWELKPNGSTYSAQFRELLVDSRDHWFGATDLCVGPDGSVYVSDFYDKRTAHPDPDADWDRTNGRIYKIEGPKLKGFKPVDLQSLSTERLVDQLWHPNGWFADRARVLLAGRRDKSIWPDLYERARHSEPRKALQALWALYATGGLDETAALAALAHASEHLRAWGVRLLCDAKSISPEMAERLAKLAEEEESVVVRVQLAASSRRLPGKSALPIVEALVLADKNADDPVFPWMLWWAVESLVDRQADRLVDFLSADRTRATMLGRANLGRLVRRLAADGTRARYEALTRALSKLSVDDRPNYFGELERGLAERAIGLPLVGQGGLFDSAATPDKKSQPARRFDPLTAELSEFLRAAWDESPTNAIRTRLALRADHAAARDRVHRDLADSKLPKTILLERLDALDELGTEACVEFVRPLLGSNDVEVRMKALGVLGRFPSPAVTTAVLAAYPKFNSLEQGRARDVLFSRRESATAFLEFVAAKKLNPADVPIDQVRRLALLNDATIDVAVRTHWGNIKPGTPEEKLAEVRRFSNDLRAGAGDSTNGKALFTKHCGVCHKLFGEGGTVGPELTNASRADTTWLLVSLVDPSAVIRAQYSQFALTTTAGQVLTGVIAEQDAASATIQDAQARKTRVPRDRIDSLRELATSIMPEKLLDPLSPQERRDLFKYLQLPAK